MKTKMKKEYAVLTKDWVYTDMVGKTITWKKGRRFLLGRTTVRDTNGDLILANWYAYGADEVIPAEYFAKK